MGIIEEKFEWDGQMPKPSNMTFTHEDANALSNTKKDLAGSPIVIAPSNSEYKDQSNEILTGSADNIPIQSIINSLPTTGAHITFLDGGISLDAPLQVQYPLTFTGQGKGATTFKTTGYFDALQVVPISTNEYTGMHFQDFTLHGNGVGRYGLSFNSKLIKGGFDNIGIRNFVDFGIYDNSNWGNVYINLSVKSNGTTAATKGGICIDGANMSKYMGCMVDWNGTGVIVKAGFMPVFDTCVIEGNQYHGYHASPTTPGCASNLHLIYCWFEQNNNAEAADMYDIYFEHANTAFNTVNGCFSQGSKVKYAVYAEGAYTHIYNYRSQNQDLYVASTSSVVVGGNKEPLGNSINVLRLMPNANVLWDINAVHKYTMQLVDTASGSVSLGDVVRFRSVAGDTTFRYVTRTVGQGDDQVFGIALGTIAHYGWGYFQTLGRTTDLKVNGTTDIAIGDLLSTSTFRGISAKAGAGDMAFAIAKEAYTTDDSNGVIDALLITPRKI